MSPKSQPCSVCGAGTATEQTVDLEMQPLGRAVRYKRRGWHCDRCDETYYDDRQLAANDAAERDAKARGLRTIDGEALRSVRLIAGLTQATFERVMGLGHNTVAPWETGAKPLPTYMVSLVRVLALHPTAVRELADVEDVAYLPKPPSHAGRPRARQAEAGASVRERSARSAGPVTIAKTATLRPTAKTAKGRRTKPAAEPRVVRVARVAGSRARGGH